MSLAINQSKTVARPTDSDFNLYLQAAKIDLANPAFQNQFWYGVPYPVDGKDDVLMGYAAIDTPTLIAMLQDSLQQSLSYYYSTKLEINKTGVWDCETAAACAVFASYLRGGVDTQGKVWVPGVEDLVALIWLSPHFQMSVNIALKANGFQLDKQAANAVPFIVRGAASYAPPAAPSCENLSSVSGDQYPVELGKLSEDLSQVEQLETSSKSSYLPWVVGGVALLGGIAAAVALSKKRGG